ncbi:hypothetical protein JCM3774_004271 [Rhodotorula dairenensis]
MGKPTAHNYASARHLSCEGCRTRKSKCSRTFPCVSCAVRGDECIWLDTIPAHGILQSSLEENFAEIRRLNKVVRQLQALLIERDHARVTATSIPHQHYQRHPQQVLGATSAVVTPPTPPGMDYLPSGLGLHAHPLVGRSLSHFELSSSSNGGGGISPIHAAGPRVYGAPTLTRAEALMASGPPMQRSQSDYGYRFPAAPSPDGSTPPLWVYDAALTTTDYASFSSLNAPARYAPPFDYRQQQQQQQHVHQRGGRDSGEELLSISPAQLASPELPPSQHRNRSTTCPSSLLAAPPDLSAAARAPANAHAQAEDPFPLPLPLAFSDPDPTAAATVITGKGGGEFLHHSTRTYDSHSAAAAAAAPPPPLTLSASPHSLKFDAAVTLAKGLAANRAFGFDADGNRSERGEEDGDHHMHPAEQGEDHGGGGDDDLYALPIPPHSSDRTGPSVNAALSAGAPTPVDLTRLATMALSRRASAEPADVGSYPVFSIPVETQPEEGGGGRAAGDSLVPDSLGAAVRRDLQPGHRVGVDEAEAEAGEQSPMQRDDADTDEAWSFQLPRL